MIRLDYLLAATGGILRYAGKREYFDAFSHDTRQLVAGELFVAVRGERGDGHDYLMDAVRQGAAGLLVEARVFNVLAEQTQAALEYAGVATVMVEDTRIALQQYARFIIAHWHPLVIAVTGSVGKTSTKEAIATVLSHKYPTFRSWQNYNDLLGLPLSLGRLEERHRYAVLELGCDHPSEIVNLCRIVQPQIGVVTNISPTQLQYFGSVERLARELAGLLSSLPAQGVALLNAEDALSRTFLLCGSDGSYQIRLHSDIWGLSQAPQRDDNPFESRLYTYASSSVTDVRVSWEGIQCVFKAMPLSCHLLGRHHIDTMLAACKVASLCGIQAEEIRQSFTDVQPLPGRLKPLPGVHSSILLDDTHNAAPASMLAGLRALRELPAGQRIAVLADMLNLGDYDEEAHRVLGREAAHCVDYLVTRGERAAMIAESARQAKLCPERIIVTSTHEDAAQATRHILQSHKEQQTKNVVLIKGSEETRMERVTELLMAEPTQAQQLLVRQTLGWKQIVFTRAERPTWVEVDLSAIANNTQRIKSLVGPRVQVLVSLKADAYGHGAVRVARTTLHNGASMLGVATVSEATPLRQAGITAPILVFGYVPPWQMREAVRQDVTVTLYALESAQALSHAALALGKGVRVHVKVDTGMGRLGVRCEQLHEVVTLLREISTLPGLELEGLYTHLAKADSSDQSHARRQLARFQEVLHALEQQDLLPPLIHTANSAATLSLPESHFTMVRPGIAIYGLDPSNEVRLPQGFRPALSFKTRVAQVKMVPLGECISYGCMHVTERPTLVATLPVGYADGFRRAPKNWGSVLIRGQEAPILGRVCMDQCMVDVTHIPQTRVGDEVVLIGQQGSAALTAEQVAERLGTINYEVVAEILARVPRVD